MLSVAHVGPPAVGGGVDGGGCVLMSASRGLGGQSVGCAGGGDPVVCEEAGEAVRHGGEVCCWCGCALALPAGVPA